MVKLLSKLPQSLTRTHYLQKVSEQLSKGQARLAIQFEQDLRNQVKGFRWHGRSKKFEQPNEISRREKNESEIIFYYLHCPDLRLFIRDEFLKREINGFNTSYIQSLWEAISKIEQNNLGLNYLNDLKQSKPNDVVVLHACCHNPSGVDLNLNQWEELAEICCKKELIPLFDMAYQGFGDNLESDTIGIKIFEKKLNTVFLANSFSKNFGLYNERIGALHIISQNKDMSETILTNIQPIVRSNYSNPPFHGAGIVTEILSDSVLKKLWMNELSSMRARIHSMRALLLEHLSSKQNKVDFNYIINQKGMFSIIDLDERQVTRLKEEFGVYLLKSGRINIAGLNDSNIKYVADSINSVY